MKGVTAIALLALAFLSVGQGCTCGKPNVTPDAGPCASASPCGACPSGCTNNDTCTDSQGWQCNCSCTVNTTNFCAEYAKRACDFYIRCHTEASLFFDTTEGRGPTSPIAVDTNQVAASERARCEARVSSAQSCYELTQSFQAGRTRFDPVAYSACQAALYPADTCSRDLNQLQELCLKTSFVVGATANGGVCQSDRECASGWCNATSTTCGTCQPYVAQDGTCSRDAQCDPASSYCSSNSNTCQPFVAADGTCQLTELTSCGPDRQCVVQGLFGFSGTCKVGKDEGTACVQGHYECKRSNRALPELLCAPQTTDAGTANLCVKLQSPPGGHCGDGEGVPDPNNPTTLIRGPFCPETQYCENKRCVDRNPVATACTSDDQCAAGLRCIDPGTGAKSCQPFVDLGGGCGASADCKNLLACDGSSKCEPDLALEQEPCPAGVTCAAGYCDTDGGSPACAAFEANAVVCGSNAECRSGACSATCQKACWEAP